MAEFTDVKNELREVRDRVNTEQRALSQEREKLKKLKLEKARVLRVHSRNSKAFKQIQTTESAIDQSISDKQEALRAGFKEKAKWIREFEKFSDPRSNMALLSDQSPILLFPVRLETRFKIISDEESGTKHQLWVRVFPDECSIDTFDDVLSVSEIEKAKSYWTTIWQAGKSADASLDSFVRDKKRGAWRQLMGVFNAGRAYWITEHFMPLNNEDIPIRNKETDVILVIPCDEVPEAMQQQALQDYWWAFYLAGNDENSVQDALEQLANDLGSNHETALRLTEIFRPQNIDETSSIDNPEVSVAFLTFKKEPDSESKLSAWTQAAEVRTFPERFVLLGYQGNNIKPIVNIAGNTIPDPIIVGPDTRDDIEELLTGIYGAAFSGFTEEEKSIKYIEYLSGQAETKWLFNFDEAVNMGLGFRVDLSKSQYSKGFSKLFVLGIKMGANQDEGQILLEKLLKNHQFGDRTFSILPQGTPTNNTDDQGSGYSVDEDPDDAFDRYFTESEREDPLERSTRRDGRWLANMLGIDVQNSALTLAENYYHSDQSEASAMHTALWNATIGYFMENMLSPVATDWEIDSLRWFLINYVSGRGKVPVIRIGNQPYGILPASPFREYKWMNQRTHVGQAYSDKFPNLQKIYRVVKTVKEDWRLFLDKVAFVGKEGDPHEVLLEALGLHASSVEYDRRIADSFASNINTTNLLMQTLPDAASSEIIYTALGMALLKRLGYEHDIKQNPRIPILEKSFLGSQEDVNKYLIDDNPLSESDPIRNYTEKDTNYIVWLIDKAKNEHRDIRDEKGFKDNKKPHALLYDMLRHAMNLEFGNTGLKLFQNANLMSVQEASVLRADVDFIGIQENSTALESKWDLIYREEPALLDRGVVLVDHISRMISNKSADPSVKYLQEQILALELLKDVPTARMERCMAEHVDCCSYRLDSWMMGFLHLQLEYMRFGGEINESDPSNGIYLGAYGMVENLKPENKELSAAELDEDLKPIFDPENKKDIKVDSKNAGYVHAPSLNHALTAAVLRNAYISTASPADAETYKINLSSERVRLAMHMMEGMRAGQSLGALLGYQLERGLHDHNLEEMDLFIYELRKVFSLGANKLRNTRIKAGRHSENAKILKRYKEEEKEFEDDKAITKIEACNVVDGQLLLDHIKKEKKEGYPFGFPIGSGTDKLRQASPQEKAAIDAEVQRLMNIVDALADLALAESVHQGVQGNFDRAAGALDSFSKGSFPQIPDVVQSNGSGTTLTNRFAIHLPPVPIAAGNLTPRGITAPRINAWLNQLIPSPDKISCEVIWTIPNYGQGAPNTPVSQFISLGSTTLMPIDLLYLEGIDSQKSFSSLDDHIVRALFSGPKAPKRLDALIEINYTRANAGDLSFFEVASMITSLRQLVLSSRPLKESDIALQNEADEATFNPSPINPDRIKNARQILKTLKISLKTDVKNKLEGWIDDESLEASMSHATEILNVIDSLSLVFADIMGGISLFGKAQSGAGYVFDRKAEIYAGLYKKILEHKKSWDEKETKYGDLIGNALPAATSEEEKIEILQKAESCISTVYDASFTDAADLLGKLTLKKAEFDTKLASMNSYLTAEESELKTLFTKTTNLLSGMEAYVSEPPTILEDLTQVVVLAEDMYKQAEKTHTLLNKNVKSVKNLVEKAEIAADPEEKNRLLTEAGKLLFGEQFQVLPEFTFSGNQAHELQNCINDQDSLLKHQHIAEEVDFPVDNWLYGIARVREKLASWEDLVQVFEGFDAAASLDLLPLQLPYQENDSWLALSYPESYEIESDKLLYTSFNPGFNPTEPQCGLLVDEWTEVIPAEKETTGMTFHYDRPNCEPPQSMLLLTPSEFTGEWQWEDVVNTLHDTLDMMQFRAIEPDHIDKTNYAKFLPATVATLTTHPVTMAINYVAQDFNFTD